MKTYIVDGYNFIYKTPELERLLDKDLKSARTRLIELCLSFKQRRGDIQKLVIVFDGDSRFAGLPRDSRSGIEVIYTETGEEADDRIVQVLEKCKKHPYLCVVSDDNFVGNHARVYSAEVISSAVFYAELIKVKASANTPKKSAEKQIPPDVARDVTDSYRRHLGL